MSAGTMDLNARRQADRTLALTRDQARDDYVEQADIQSKADAEYRRVKATTFLECRDKGLPANGAEIIANAAASEAKQRRDIAASLARAALLKIEGIDRQFVSVRDIHSTSERIDGLAA